MYENIVAIHNVLKKKITKLNSQPAQYEKKNRQTILEKKIKKSLKKTMWGNTVAIHCVLKRKKLQS